MRLLIVSSGFADSTIKPVDRQEGEGIGTDEFSHAFEIQARCEKLVAFRSVDAVEVRVRDRRAGKPEVHFAGAGIAFALALARREGGMPPATELLLMFAARAAHVTQRIEPALARGEWVLCDRFSDASRAYQGGGRGIDTDHIEHLVAIAHPGLAPDLTLLLDLPPGQGLARARQRGDDGDRFEDERLAFFARVRAHYLQLAAAEPARIRIIDATATPAAVLAQALAALEGL